MGSRRVLYISYDGLMEPLGYTQVLGYVKELSRTHSVTLLTFEKRISEDQQAQLRALEREVKACGIDWIALRYHKSPSLLATSYDIFSGALWSAWFVVQKKIDFIHARSYVATAIALALKKLFGVPYLFDMRGFWVDEKVEVGSWKKNTVLYRFAKFCERIFLKNAHTVISLTQIAADTIHSFDYLKAHCPPIRVIPTCTDLRRFTLPTIPEKKDTFVFGYVGAISRYRFDWAIESFRVLTKYFPELNPHFLIINQGEHNQILSYLTENEKASGRVTLSAATAVEMPHHLAKMDAAVFLADPSFSKLAMAPTKLGEFLASGIPCLTNYGIGDAAQIVESSRVGAVISDFSLSSIGKGVQELVKLSQEVGIREKCRETAERVFSLHKGTESYHMVYRSFPNRRRLGAEHVFKYS